jgi:hypothetical protein
MFLDDSHLRKSIFSPICSYCKHFDIGSAIAEVRTCAAFPIGIPTEIWKGDNNHTNPYPGDQGITFLKRKPNG